MPELYTPARLANRSFMLAQAAAKMLSIDWRTKKYIFFGGLLVLLTTLLVVVYYLNHPQPEPYPDTYDYLRVAQLIQTQGQVVDSFRVPGFPLLITIVFALTGQGNFVAVSIVHAVLFILATLETYILALVMLRRRWVALFIGLLVGMNITLISYIKPILSEALALWLLVSLTLSVVFFVHTLRARHLWLVTMFTLALFLTRPEWIYVPIPLFSYLIFVAARHGTARRLILHALASIILLYIILGGYVLINAKQNQFVGVTAAQNINFWGKVIQYDMQNEAPPQFAGITQITDMYRSQGIQNPNYILGREPSLFHNHFALVGDYAWAIIVHHPREFLAKSIPVALASLSQFYPESRIDSHGPLSGPLIYLQSIFLNLYAWNKFMPLCAMVWIVLLCWRRTARLRSVQAMGAIVLLALYGLTFTTLGGFESYTRYHTPFNPLLIIIVWGTLLAGSLLVVQQVPGRIVQIVNQYFHLKDISLSTGNILVAIIGLVGLLPFTVDFLLTQRLSSQVGIVCSLIIFVGGTLRYLGLGKK